MRHTVSTALSQFCDIESLALTTWVVRAPAPVGKIMCVLSNHKNRLMFWNFLHQNARFYANCAENAFTRSTFSAQNAPAVVWQSGFAGTRWGSLSLPPNTLRRHENKERRGKMEGRGGKKRGRMKEETVYTWSSK